MSFSSEVKAEIASDIPSARHCRIASAAVLLTCMGRFERDADGKYRLFLSQDNREALRKCFTLVCKTSNIRNVVCSPAGTGSREPRGWLHADLSSDTVRDLAQMIRACDSAGNLRENDECTVPAELLGRSCCRRNYLRDLFLCCGSVSDPRKEYHLEWSCGSKEQASQLKEILLSFGKEAKDVIRKKVNVVYFKDSEDIVDLLNLMGAPISMMEMENQRILKESGILRTLPESLRKMAELRLQYPDTPLRELGDLAVPPIGKSGVNHRLRRLTEIAEKYRTESRNEKRASGAGQKKKPDSAVKESM